MKKTWILLLILCGFAMAQRPYNNQRSGYAQNILWRDLHPSTQDSIRKAVSDSLAALSADGETIINDGTLKQKVFADSTAIIAATPDSIGQRLFLLQRSSSDSTAGGIFVYSGSGTDDGGITGYALTSGGYVVREDYLLTGEVKLKNAGVKADGTTNDKDAVQRAIVAASNLGTTLYWGGMQDTILIASKIFLTGDYYIDWYGSATIKTTTNSLTSSLIDIYNNSIDRPRIRNLTFDATGTTNTVLLRIGGLNRTTGTKSAVVEGCKFIGAEYGLYLWNSGNYNEGRIVGNDFQNCTYGLYLGTRAEYYMVAENSADSCTYGIYVLGGNNSLVNNSCNYNTYGLYLQALAGLNSDHMTVTGGQYNHNLTAGIVCDSLEKGVTITGACVWATESAGSHLDGTVSPGIGVYKGRGVNIVNCQIMNNNAGVYFYGDSVFNPTVSNSQIGGTTSHYEVYEKSGTAVVYGKYIDNQYLNTSYETEYDNRNIFISSVSQHSMIGNSGTLIINNIATGFNVYNSQSGFVFTNASDTDTSSFLLPSAYPGYEFEFVKMANQSMTIKAASGDAINGGSAAGAIENVASETLKKITLLAVDATNWIVKDSTGTWTVTP